MKEVRFITDKPILYAANVAEEEIGQRLERADDTHRQTGRWRQVSTR